MTTLAKNNSQIISFFNNKGGVSKTTTCFNLGWMLATLGKTVIMVDADPQCNLTGLVLETLPGELLPQTYRSNASDEGKKANIYDALLPALKSTGEKLSVPECVNVANNSNLFLLPGNVKMAEVETQLGTAMNVGAVMPAMQNVPGSFAQLYTLLAEKYETDFILVDLSPSLGAINQVNVLSSDYFIVPMMPDVFSVMAVDSLSRALPGWIKWAKRVEQSGWFADQDLIYPFKPKAPKFLGTVLQRYNRRSGRPTKAFEKYFKDLQEVISAELIPAMAESDLLLKEEIYEATSPDFRLAEIPDFNSLIATAQNAGKPVYELEPSDLKNRGAVETNQMANVDSFRQIFRGFAERIIALTDAARNDSI